ncbi:hypothetical protein Pfo_013024 [Paulownia fortunei]|nr:hypothetical protein Pfo_013024 [Paulownia fortunei]
MSTDQESPPAQTETTSKGSPLSNNPTPSLTTGTATNKPETDDAKTLKQDSDPNVKETPPAKTETTSKDSAPSKDALSQTTPFNNPKTEDGETLKQGSATDVDPHMLEKTPSENETTSKNTSPTKNDSTQNRATNEQETDDTEAIKQDSAAGADPHVQEIIPVENETASKHSSPPKNSPTQIAATRKPETDGNKDCATDADPHVQEVTTVKNETTLKDSSPPDDIPTQITPTHQPELHENKTLKEVLPYDADPHPPVQEISPADDETTSKKLSPTKNDFTQTTGVNHPETEGAETLKQDSISYVDPRSKKISSLKKFRNLFLKIGKRSQPKPAVASQGTKVESTTRNPDEKELLSKLIQADVDYIERGAKKLGQYNDQLNSVLKEASKEFEDLKKQGEKEDFRDLRKAMIKLKLQIPSKYKVDADEKDPHKHLQFTSKAKQSIPVEVRNMMPQLHKNDVFESSMEFKDFEARYNELHLELKLCLLCFSVYPENAIIKKRLMVQWWVAEGFACEDVASEYFLQLIEKGFIEPVNENRSLFVGRCRMHPFYRSALVMLAERAKFLNFDANGEPTQNFSGSFQACLVGEGLISYEDYKNNLVTVDDLEKIHLLINVKEPILEFKTDWFSKMRNVNFLYLGRWEASATDHKEVEDTMFLDGLENMNYMKFLSLQGVSNIIALPESILQLTNLKILDLRACHNLETIPEGIGLLKSLTHLDMSECYLLDHMPKGLSLLTGLRVLKGFVVGSEKGKSSCTLDDLKELPNLIKLCIYTGLREFPDEKHVIALGSLIELRKLTITWGGSALRTATDNGSDIVKPSDGNKKDNSTAEKTTQKQEPQESLDSSNGSSTTPRLPSKLEKLDLKCFPMSKTPDWLALNNLKDLNLKKLYIRGGKFSDLGQYQDIDYWNLVWPVKKDTWKAQVLRLKYLSEIEMEWRQLQELFPHLVYLEQVSCPKLTLFPCDANGIWMNKTKLKAF